MEKENERDQDGGAEDVGLQPAGVCVCVCGCGCRGGRSVRRGGSISENGEYKVEGWVKKRKDGGFSVSKVTVDFQYIESCINIFLYLCGYRFLCRYYVDSYIIDFCFDFLSG